MPLPKDFQKTYQVDGHEVSVQVCPYSWMYPHGRSGVKFTLVETDQFAYRDKLPKFEDLTEADIDALVPTLGVAPCSRGCGQPRFFESDSGNRGTLCESCFGMELLTEYAESKKRDEKRQRREELAQYRAGMRWKVTAWVHPARGGDDYPVTIYSNLKPTKAVIVANLRSEGSCRFDDHHKPVRITPPMSGSKAKVKA